MVVNAVQEAVLEIDEDNDLFADLRINPTKYPYLIKTFDSDEVGYKNHFMIYEIDYKLFDLLEKNISVLIKSINTEEIKSIFIKEHLKLTNVNNIQQILRSKEWKDFYDTLLDDDSNNALEVCKRYCGTTKSTKLKLHANPAYARATPADGMEIQYKIKDNSTAIKIRAIPDKRKTANGYGEQNE